LKTDVTLFIGTDTSCQTLHTTIHSHGSLFNNTSHTFLTDDIRRPSYVCDPHWLYGI